MPPSDIFLLLERAGNGYLMKPTGDRGDVPMRMERFGIGISTPDGVVTVNSFFDIETWIPVISDATIRHLVPGTTHYSGSTTATIRQITARKEDTGVDVNWFFDISYVGAGVDDHNCFLDVVFLNRASVHVTDEFFNVEYVL